MSSERKVDRRHFFREGLRELIKPLVNSIEPMQEALRQFDRLAPNETRAASEVSRSAKQRARLRPPGAKSPEQSFVDACSRCGACVDVCPAKCIRIDPTGSNGQGAPYIDPDVMACVLCDGLKCMHVCPTGALSPIPLAEIRMGTAVWNYESCLRSRGENCTICIDQCPVGSVAIELRANMVFVNESGCTGCGVCQQQCPTSPKSIVVVPRES
jgi:MauM/NapG family ferredoxin protein